MKSVEFVDKNINFRKRCPFCDKVLLVPTWNYCDSVYCQRKYNNKRQKKRYDSKKIVRRNLIENNRKSHLGKKLSLETKLKMSESHSGSKNSMYGKKQSLKTRQLISNSKVGKMLKFY